MKGKKKSTKQKNIYTRTYEERGACVPWGLAPPEMGTLGMGTGPRERCGSCSHTQCSHPGLGGQRGLPRVAAGPEQRSNAFGGGSHLHCPPISSLQRPQGRAQCWGGAASTHFGG